LARNLDLLEQSYREDTRNNNSMNMDDTGFFSVQVIENALKVWGLNLVRWRSEEMRPYHERPHAQLAFILNLEQHWFTLRRFGHAEPSLDNDAGRGHWFNLNSCLPSPEWVGKLYLDTVLQQSEAEGYSVFAVVQSDPSAPLALTRTEADYIAATLPDPNSNVSPLSAARSPRDEAFQGFEEEDFELQAALQASLAGSDHPGAWGDYSAGPSTTPGVTSVLSRTENVDPVTASIERNRLMLQRMREEQEYAQREALTLSAEGMTPEQIAAQDARREARRRQEEEEEENLRRAIAESEAMAGRRNSANEVSTHAVPNAFPDDDDVQLQAVLRASLEQANGTHNATQTEEVNGSQASETLLLDGVDSAAPSLSSVLDLDEIRKRRLAKFSG